jgi:hypothetical protein
MRKNDDELAYHRRITLYNMGNTPTRIPKLINIQRTSNIIIRKYSKNRLYIIMIPDVVACQA